MTFYEFASANPGTTLILGIIVCLTVESCVSIVCKTAIHLHQIRSALPRASNDKPPTP